MDSKIDVAFHEVDDVFADKVQEWSHQEEAESTEDQQVHQPRITIAYDTSMPQAIGHGEDKGSYSTPQVAQPVVLTAEPPESETPVQPVADDGC